jgi:hypothetical protein
MNTMTAIALLTMNQCIGGTCTMPPAAPIVGSQWRPATPAPNVTQRQPGRLPEQPKHPATVEIKSHATDRIKHGRGVYLGDGLILACAHILGAGWEPRVAIGGETHRAEIVDTDALLDLSLLRIPDTPAPSMRLAPDDPEPGTRVTTAGRPGTVLGYRKKFLVARSQVNNGESGSPIYSNAGIVGILAEQETIGNDITILGPSVGSIRKFIEEATGLTRKKDDLPMIPVPVTPSAPSPGIDEDRIREIIAEVMPAAETAREEPEGYRSQQAPDLSDMALQALISWGLPIGLSALGLGGLVPAVMYGHRGLRYLRRRRRERKDRKRREKTAKDAQKQRERREGEREPEQPSQQQEPRDGQGGGGATDPPRGFPHSEPEYGAIPRKADDALQLVQLGEQEGRSPLYDALIGRIALYEAERLIDGNADELEKEWATRFRNQLLERLNSIAPPAV